ncbi:NAD(P)-binding protein [Favolaschia claudopus]|uniref:NAD(P)-binding protein n=1 Tax=Favolaschia claudopus TaxID=2862362 RepID=A0AAW0D0G6_9AGAR
MSFYVVTGAARGLGFEFVSQLSSNNQNTVFALVRNKSSATALNDLSRPNVTVLEADITDSVAIQVTAAIIAAVTGGKLDYLINNAAVHNRSPETLSTFPSKEALDTDLLEKFQVNVLGTIHTTNAFIPLLRAADLDAALGSNNAGQTAYAISKAALNMAVAKYAMAHKSEGFVFLSVAPGLVDTETETGRTPEEEAQYQAFIQKLKALAPDFEGPITPEQSVKMMLEVIHRWTVDRTGAFVSQHGTKKWL